MKRRAHFTFFLHLKQVGINFLNNIRWSCRLPSIIWSIFLSEPDVNNPFFFFTKWPGIIPKHHCWQEDSLGCKICLNFVHNCKLNYIALNKIWGLLDCLLQYKEMFRLHASAFVSAFCCVQQINSLFLSQNNARMPFNINLLYERQK